MNYLSPEAIESFSLFSHIKQKTLQKIIAKSHMQTYKADETIFRDKDHLSFLYIVLEGNVSLYKTHSNGQNKVIFMLSKGEILNESLCSDLPSAINCKAYSDCTILALYKKDLLLLCQEDPRLMENFMNAFSKRIRRLYRQLKNATSVIKMEKKLAAKLWKLSHDYGISCDQGVIINFPITITSLADFLGSYRETVSRALKYLIENDLVIYENKFIIIPDPDKLSLYFKTN